MGLLEVQQPLLYQKTRIAHIGIGMKECREGVEERRVLLGLDGLNKGLLPQRREHILVGNPKVLNGRCQRMGGRLTHQLGERATALQRNGLVESCFGIAFWQEEGEEFH